MRPLTIGTAGRRESDYRQSGDDVVARLRFVRQAKELGFTLKEVGELLGLPLDDPAIGSDVR